MQLTLDSGLRLVIERVPGTPVVALQAWVAAGSADEPTELRGVSHFLEHMLFKGTGRRPVGQIAREVEAAGGEINAWTSLDETVFHVVMARAFLADGLDILADALLNSSFDPAELERERQVILEEVKQGLDDPDRAVSQAMMEGVFAGHPYAHPVIGTAETVARMSRDDIVGYYRAHYHAARLTLVVVGDVEVEEVRRVASAAFAGLPAGPPLGVRARPAPAQARTRLVTRDVKEAQLLLGFSAPAVSHDDVPALDLLAVVLGHGESSRLHRSVVRTRQLAKSAHGYLFAARDGGALVFGANVGAGRVDAAARAILDELQDLTRADVEHDELEKARTILESERVFERETVQGQARKLGYFAAVVGQSDHEERYLRAVAGLSAGDLRRVAQRYLRPEHLVLVAQVPEVPRGARGEAARDRLRQRLDLAVREAFAAAPADTPARGGSGDSAVLHHVFESGLRLVVQRDPSVPVVALRAMWLGGLRLEDERNNGISNLIAALLTRGTTTRSAERLAAEIEGLAGSLTGYAGRNSLGLQGEFLARHWERGLELLADCAQHATFNEDELDKERRIILDDIRAQDDNPGHAAFRLFHGTLWRRHPYRLDQLGTAESVGGLTRRRLLIHFQKFYSPGALTLAIVGDVDPVAVRARVERLFERATTVAARPALPAPAPELPVAQARQAVAWLEREQAHVVLGFPGLTLDHPDRYALEVLTQILSGQGGRLFDELRERRGLVYRVSAFSMEGIDPGYAAIYLAASPRNLDEALQITRTELERLRREGVTDEEVDRVRRYLIGANAIGLQRRGALAGALAFHEAHGQGWQAYRSFPERIAAVTRSDVERVARALLDPAREVLAVVKPRAATPRAAAQGAAARSP